MLTRLLIIATLLGMSLQATAMAVAGPGAMAFDSRCADAAPGTSAECCGGGEDAGMACTMACPTGTAVALASSTQAVVGASSDSVSLPQSGLALEMRAPETAPPRPF